MKIKLSNLATLLLAAAVFAVPACTDYSADIESIKKDVSSQGTQIASLESQLSTLNSTVSTLQSNVTTLQSDVKSLKSAQSALETKDKELEKSISDLNTSLTAKIDEATKAAAQALTEKISEVTKAYKDADEALKNELNGNIDALATKVTANAESIKNLNGDVEDLKTAVTNLTTSLGEFKSEVEGKLTELEGRVADCEKKIEAAETAIETINKVTIPALKESIDKKADAQDLEDYKTKTNETLEAMKLALTALTMTDLAIIEAVDSTCTVFINTFEAYVAANDAAVAAKVDTAVFNAQIASLKGSIAAAEANAALYTDAQIDSVKAYFNDKCDVLAGRISVLETSLADLQTKVAELETSLSDAVGRITALENRCGVIEGDIDTINSKITTLNTTIASLQSQIDVLKRQAFGDLTDLWNRIQSVVYVPEYTDGQATISYLINNDRVISGANTFTYDVMPADKADSIAAAFIADPKNFKMKVTALKTRADDEMLVLNIKNITAANGQINVTVVPTGIDPSKYLTQSGTAYSASLQLNAKGDVRSTEYVNIYTDVLSVKLSKFAKVAEDGKVTPITVDDVEKFEYINTEDHQIYKGMEAVFENVNVANELYSQKQLLEKFNLPVDSLHVSYLVWKTSVLMVDPQQGVLVPADSATASLFQFKKEIVAWDAIPQVTVNLDPAKSHAERAAAIDYVAFVEFIAGSEGLNVPQYDTTGSKCNPNMEQLGLPMAQVTKAKFSVKMNSDNIKWAYGTDDYYVDKHHALDGSKEKYINKTVAATPDSNDVKSLKDFGITIKDFEDVPASSYTVKDGEKKVDVELNNVVITSTGITYGVTNFEYAKDYSIEAVYSLPLADVTLKSNLKTIDRQRDTIVVTYPDSTFALTQDATLTAVADIIAPVWEVAKNYTYITDYFGKDSVKFFNYFFNMAGQVDTRGPEAVEKGVYWAKAYGNQGGNYVSFVYPDTIFGTVNTYDTWMSAWGQVIKFQKNLSVKHNFNLIASSVYTSKDENGTYFSQVAPKYTYEKDTDNISAFDVNKVDLNRAFYVKLGDKDTDIIDPDSYAAKGISVTWAFKEKKDKNITLDLTQRYLSYYGSDKTVTVAPTFTFTTNARKTFTIPQPEFDSLKTYYGYYVKKFNPVKSFSTNSSVKDGVYTVTVSQVGKKSVDLYSLLSMIDSRGYQMCSADANHSSEGFIKGYYTTGKNPVNTTGFADGKCASEVYSFDPFEFKITADPELTRLGIITTQGAHNNNLIFDYTAEQTANQVECTVSATAGNKFADPDDNQTVSFKVIFKVVK